MGVYIPKMEMPKTCEQCNLESFCDLWVLAREMTTGIPHRATIRHSDCPLTEVPKHGLIDKQMLLRNIADNQFAHSSVGHEEDYAFWGKVWDYINDAPTIIEAEGDDG